MKEFKIFSENAYAHQKWDYGRGSAADAFLVF